MNIVSFGIQHVSFGILYASFGTLDVSFVLTVFSGYMPRNGTAGSCASIRQVQIQRIDFNSSTSASKCRIPGKQMLWVESCPSPQPNSCANVLTPRTSEYGLIWRQSHCRCC